MKRIVEYITQKGEVLKLTEIVSDFTNWIKIYLPLNYRVLYTGYFEGMRYISEDFTEDDKFHKALEFGMEHFYIINMTPEFINFDDTSIYGRNINDDNDRFIRIAANSYVLDVWTDNGKLANITYCIHTKELELMQFVKLIDDDYPTMDYFTRGDLIDETNC